jgi:2-polyprenyl-6-methoxyphenol hydroxylase-like FAD-dependent oxidoreductase
MNDVKLESGGRTTCAIAGGGPAGIMLSLLLARAGIEVTVLEKHADFLRDFRGDIVHPSTMTLLDELGLGDEFRQLPRRLVRSYVIGFDRGPVSFDLKHIPSRHKYIALVPQWDLLEMLAKAAAAEDTFRLYRNTQVTGLLRSEDRVSGVTFRTADGDVGTLAADLVVACDGRNSILSAAAGLPKREFGLSMDALWFRLPRSDGDFEGMYGRFNRRHVCALIDRGSYYQCVYMIGKGTFGEFDHSKIEELRGNLATLVPFVADRVDSLSADEIYLLDVQVSRLKKWYSDGLLCIGDAAHAMSQVGGIGINLAISDAVAAARILAEPLQCGTLKQRHLAQVQARRWSPTAAFQAFQRVVHHRIAGSVGLPDDALGNGSTKPALWMRSIERFSWLQVVPGSALANGLLPEHAPAFARRAS